MCASTRYSLEPMAGRAEAGNGTVSVSEDGLVVDGTESVYRFGYRDIRSIDADNYQLELVLEPGTRLSLTKLGREFDPLVRALYEHRNSMLIEDLLINEPLRLRGIDARLEYRDPRRGTTIESECEVRLYETGIVFLPRADLPVRLPYGTIVDVTPGNYSLRIETDAGEVARLSKLGRRFAALQKGLAERRSALTEATVALLESVLPETDPVVRSRLASQMRDGRAVSRQEVSAEVGTDVWGRLEAALEAAGIGAEYEYVESQAVHARVSIGVKRGLQSGSEAEYLWTLVPVGDTDHTEPGNAIVMEASGGSTARATYLFQITPVEEYAEIESQEALDRTVTEAIQDVNRAMLGVNFRREPIYLSREKLAEPRYATYHSALTLVPALDRLREAFLGRVHHRSLDQWRRDVDELLAKAITSEPPEAAGDNSGPPAGPEG